MYGQNDEKTGIGYHRKGSDNLAMKFVTLKKNMEYRLEKYGFNGITYPRKMFICSETGLSDVSFGDEVTKVGGNIVRRNYVLKQMLYAREYGIKQSHWLCIADYGKNGGSGDFGYISDKTVDTAELKDSSKGRLVWKKYQLGKMTFHHAKTESLRNDLKSQRANVTAIALAKSGRTSWPFSPNEEVGEPQNVVYAFWRVCDEDSEITEATEITVKMNGPCSVVYYDGKVEKKDSKEVKIKVDGTPVFIMSVSEELEPEAASINTVALPALLLLFLTLLLL